MNTGLMESYLAMARSAGVEVAVFPADELADRLSTFLQELRPAAAACPTAGWAEPLWEAAVSALGKAGCTVVRPHQGVEGFSWDRDALAAAELGITPCEAYIAETGSLFFYGGAGSGSLASLLPPVHLALSAARSGYPDLGTRLGELPRPLPSRLHLITGPSRTGDIEATLSTGVHGPRRVVHWIVV